MKLWFSASLVCAAVGLATIAPAWPGALEDGESAFHNGDYALALQLLRPLAVDGDSGAQVVLGALYQNGDGLPQDYAQAFLWFHKAADQGNASGQFNIGLMYYVGQGVPQDYAQAAAWYRKAAEQGNAIAQNSLGVMYYVGKGVQQDYPQAHMWFNVAAARAEDGRVRDMAVENRDLVATKMTPEQIAEAQRLARTWAPK